MKIKGLVIEDFLQYKKPSMFIITSQCSFKCEKECGIKGICQNSPLVKQAISDINDDLIVSKYLNNDITKAIVFGGLEPLDQLEEVINLIKLFRNKTNDDIVIYTGYKEEEILEIVDKLKQFNNIIIKFGRFVPNCESHLDEILGVELASDNQYAVKIS